MKNSKERKGILAWCIALGMAFSMMSPMLCYAAESETLVLDGTEYQLETEPYESEQGLMANAKELASAFGLESSFDAENKAFTMTDEKHGEVILVHNATQFSSNGNIYDCAPYFQVENGVPMIELGFMCSMYSAAYKIDGNKIVIKTGAVSDNVARVVIDSKVTPLYIEPFKTDDGLFTSAAELASAFGLEVSYDDDDKSITFTDEKHGEVVLHDKAESFTSRGIEFECAPLFFVENGVPIIETGFFCEMYGASYDYDDTKALTIYKDTPMPDKNNNDISLMASSGTLSGTVKYSTGAPTNGLNVKLILQQNSVRYGLYGSVTRRVGENYLLGNVTLTEQEKQKSFTYDVSKYQSSTYPTYSIFYEEDNIKEYGYYNRSGLVSSLNSSPRYNKTYYDDAQHFNFNSESQMIIPIDRKYSVSGNMELTGGAAPSKGLDVGLVIQTRTDTRKNIYGGVYYNIGSTHSLGDVHFDGGENEKQYSYIIQQLYNSEYPYFTLFTVSDSGYLPQYAYYNDNGKMTKVDKNPKYNTVKYLNSRAFNVAACYTTADISLPIRGSGTAETAKAPTASISGGAVEKGTKVSLSSATSGASIYYTTDGSTPTASDTRYTVPIEINNDVTIKAIAVKSGMNNSSVSTFNYTIKKSTGEDESGSAEFEITAGSMTMKKNGETITLREAPFYDGGKIYMAVRDVADKVLECVCNWNNETRTVTYYIGSKAISYTVGDGNCRVLYDSTYVNIVDLLGKIGKRTELSGSTVKAYDDGTTAKGALLTVGEVSGKAGQLIDVPIKLTQNPGVAIIGFNVNYDSSKMTLVTAELGDIFTGNFDCNIAKVPYMFNVYDTNDKKNDGTLVTLTFEMKSDCPEGSYDITLTGQEAFNIEEDDVELTLKNGKITVRNVLLGDVNGDGVFNKKDLLRLAKHFSGYDVQIDEAAADVTGDGKVTQKDLLRIAKYFSGYAVEFGK